LGRRLLGRCDVGQQPALPLKPLDLPDAEPNQDEEGDQRGEAEPDGPAGRA
jgi:hypothetical protein